MAASLRPTSLEASTVATSLSSQWQTLCSTYLPVVAPKSIWRYSRPSMPDDPGQGWKLHISATILTAVHVLKAIAPFLKDRGTQFKGVASLDDLSRLNSGLYYGYSQVGKFITVYPESERESVFLAQRLHELTSKMAGPAAPFDEQFTRGSCVSYRYGSFRALEVENPDGTRALAIRDPQGNLVPDRRDVSKPNWIQNPFPVSCSFGPNDSPLKTTYRVFKALVQRGKGGVYQAVDISTDPLRLCVIKEGRQNGETSWDSRDGHWRAWNEERVLRALRLAKVDVPEVYASFEVESNFYVVTEFVEGITLQALLGLRQRRLNSNQIMFYASQLAELMSRIHLAGWAWRDCKPSNIIVNKAGTLRPLDFEGASAINEPDLERWGTPGYLPPEWLTDKEGRWHEAQDLYALGASIYFLLTGGLPKGRRPVPVEQLRRKIHPLLVQIVHELLASNPRKRPAASRITRLLNKSRSTNELET